MSRGGLYRIGGRWKAGMLAVVCWGATICGVFAQTETQGRETLRGLKGVGVFVEPLSPEVEQGGLTTPQLQTDVVLQLRKAGIPVLREEEVPNTPGMPLLLVHVNAFKRAPGPYAVSVLVAVYQRVALERNQHTSFAQTWSTSFMGMVGEEELSQVRDGVAAEIEKFINAYLAVNPEATVESSQAGNAEDPVS